MNLLNVVSQRVLSLLYGLCPLMLFMIRVIFVALKKLNSVSENSEAKGIPKSKENPAPNNNPFAITSPL